jgi:integrase
MAVCKRGTKWYADLYINGRRVRKAAGKSKREALRLQELLQLENSVQEQQAEAEAPAPPELVPSEPLSLRELLRLYRLSLAARAKQTSLHQLDVHQGTLERHFGQAFDVTQLTLPDLDAFIAARLEKVKRPTVNGSLSILRAALNYARDAGVLRELPVRVRLLKEGRRLLQVLTFAQVETLLARAAPPFDLMILLAAQAGLRHQEIMHLQRRDMQLPKQLQVSAKPGWTPKSHHERMVPLTSRLALRLEKHIADLNDESPTAWLFPGCNGGGRPRRHAHERIREVFKRAGLYEPAMKPGLHSLRKTWASTLLHEGVDLKTLQELGGWGDLKTLSDHYLTSLPGSKEAAIALLERMD